MKDTGSEELHPSCHDALGCCADGDSCGPIYRHEDFETAEKVDAEAEELASNADQVGEAPYGYLYPMGIMPLVYISPARMRAIQEAEGLRAEKKDRKKPPKPPSRPNARIGHVALGNVF